MAQIMTKRGNLDNITTYEFVCDTTADLQAIDPQYITMGSVATVIEGDSGFEVYMANSQHQWTSLGSAASSGGNSSGGSTANEKIIQGIPTIIDDQPTNEYVRVTLNNYTISGDTLESITNRIQLPILTKSVQWVISEQGVHDLSSGVYPAMKVVQNNVTGYVPINYAMLTDTALYLYIDTSSSPTHIAFLDQREHEQEFQEIMTQMMSATPEQQAELTVAYTALQEQCKIEEYDITGINNLSYEQWEAKYGGGE